MYCTIFIFLLTIGLTNQFLVENSTTSCAICSGPDFICEQRFHNELCHDATQQYCINKLTNNRDRTRTVHRKCASEAECLTEWWVNTSNRSECTTYDLNTAYAFRFECSYCCKGSFCNRDLIPSSLAKF